MELLEMLRERNPGVPFYSVYDGAFKRFGRVVEFSSSNLIKVCEETAIMPHDGSKYVPAMAELEALAQDYEAVHHELRGESSSQIGCCWGHSTRLNCLEYHRSSEHNIAVSDLVLLLASQQDMEGAELDSGTVSAFLVPKGTTIEVYATTLHFCPCQVSDEGFRCIVILPQGTNHPLDRPRSQKGEGRLLWAQDKWLIAHEQNEPVLARGAYPGLHGANYEIHYKEVL